MIYTTHYTAFSGWVCGTYYSSKDYYSIAHSTSHWFATSSSTVNVVFMTKIFSILLIIWTQEHKAWTALVLEGTHTVYIKRFSYFIIVNVSSSLVHEILKLYDENSFICIAIMRKTLYHLVYTYGWYVRNM